MKIVYITASLPYGPGEPFSVPEIEGLRRIGHHVTVVPMYPRGKVMHVAADWLGSVVTEKVISPGMAWGAFQSLPRSRGSFHRLVSLLAQSRNPRIWAKNAAVLPKGIWLAEMAQNWGADHIHANWASCPATIGLIASELSGIPWSFTGHRWDIMEDNLLTLKAERASFVRFISESGRELALSAGSPLASQKARVVHLGVPLAKVDMNRARGVRGRVPVVLCSAYLIPHKAHADLIGAVRILQDSGVDCELWLAGDGPLRQQLGEQVGALNLSGRVRFLGQLPHEGIIELYRSGAIDCMAHPSLAEGIPVSLIEAMSFGIPVVATHVGGIPELLRDGCGILVPPHAPDALAAGIAEVLTSETVSRELALAGRARVEAEFAVEHTVEELSALFTGSPSYMTAPVRIAL